MTEMYIYMEADYSFEQYTMENKGPKLELLGEGQSMGPL